MITKLSQLHVGLRKQAYDNTLLRMTLKQLARGGVLGAGAGAVVGGVKDKENGRTRLQQILRSALTGAATGAGIGAAAPAAITGGLSLADKLRLSDVNSFTLSMGATGAGMAGGGAAGYAAAHSRPGDTKEKLKALLGIGK